MRSITILIISLISISLFGQLEMNKFPVGSQVQITLKRGTLLTGTILEILENKIVIESNTLGVIDVISSNIQEIEFFDPEVDPYESKTAGFYGKNWITETAIGLPKGDKLYQNVMLGGNSFAFGISDNFTLGGGFELFSVFANDFPIVFISPKLTVSSSENLHFGIGSNLLLAPDGPNTAIAGSVYGLVTIGNTNHNLTAGLGYAFFDFDSAELPAIQIGGMTRISNKFMLVTDHLLVSDNRDSAFAGTWTLRYFKDKFSLDFGVAAYYSEIAIPVLGISIRY